MGYDTWDFTESMKIAGVQLEDIDKVHWGYGNVDEEGKCCDGCGGEWSGAFCFTTKDGKHGVVSGSCDYTGWGCQDGADIEWVDTIPEPPKGADIDPADLNEAIKEDSKLFD